MEQSELLAVFVQVCNRLDIDYLITGSIASSYFGEPRFTNDIDVIAGLNRKLVAPFCNSFPAPEYYISRQAVEVAVSKKKQFNLLHPTTGLKIDIFVMADSEFDRSRFNRRKFLEIDTQNSAWFAAPEDIIIKKMAYYREGHSEKHVRDILGILKIQRRSIEFDYLTHWSDKLGLSVIWRTILDHLDTDSSSI